MPSALLVGCVVMGAGSGAVLGFVRGLGYLPTLPVAIIEGAVLIGVPAMMVGLVLTGVRASGSALHRRAGAQRR